MRIIISVCLCDYVFVSFTLDARGHGEAGCVRLPLCKPPTILALSRWALRELSYVITKWLRNKTKATGF